MSPGVTLKTTTTTATNGGASEGRQQSCATFPSGNASRLQSVLLAESHNMFLLELQKCLDCVPTAPTGAASGSAKREPGHLQPGVSGPGLVARWPPRP